MRQEAASEPGPLERNENDLRVQDSASSSRLSLDSGADITYQRLPVFHLKLSLERHSGRQQEARANMA